MISLEDFIRKNFGVGSIHFNGETHVTPNGIVKFRLVTNKIGHHDEFECIVHNNVLKVIENDYVKDKSR